MITGLPPAPIALSTLSGRVGSCTLRVGAEKSPSVNSSTAPIFSTLSEPSALRGGCLSVACFATSPASLPLPVVPSCAVPSAWLGCRVGSVASVGCCSAVVVGCFDYSASVPLSCFVFGVNLDCCCCGVMLRSWSTSLRMSSLLFTPPPKTSRWPSALALASLLYNDNTFFSCFTLFQ